MSAARRANCPRRTEDVVLRLLAELAAAPKDRALTRLMNFKPGSEPPCEKTTVSAVLRDEKRAAQEDEPLPDAPLMRLPRFMEEQQMTGAQIGTAFHRMMRMLDLDALRATRDLAAEIDRQRAALLEKGVVSENEARRRASAPARAAVRLAAGRAHAGRRGSCTANGRSPIAGRPKGRRAALQGA